MKRCCVILSVLLYGCFDQVSKNELLEDQSQQYMQNKNSQKMIIRMVRKVDANLGVSLFSEQALALPLDNNAKVATEIELKNLQAHQQTVQLQCSVDLPEGLFAVRFVNGEACDSQFISLPAKGGRSIAVELSYQPDHKTNWKPVDYAKLELSLVKAREASL